MLRMFATGIVVWAVVATAAMAQGTNQCLPNGCGPDGWLGTVVPQSILGCHFKEACDGHDKCYSRCLECGDLYGQATCNGTCEDKRERKQACDTEFYNKLLVNNPGPHCRLAATAYYYAVRYKGCSYFRKYRGEQRSREDIQRDFEAIFQWLQENPDQAIVVESGKTLERLSTIEASEENRVTIRQSQLALHNEGVAERRGRPRATPVPKKTLNGIDVTDMALGGEPFDLEAAKRTKPGFDSDGLTQQTLPPQ
jgi:hypothetical protein